MRTLHLLVWSLGMLGLSSACGDGGGRIASIDAPEDSSSMAAATVAGGVKARSPNFMLTTTTTSGTGHGESPSFEVKSGIVGATQSAAGEER